MTSRPCWGGGAELAALIQETLRESADDKVAPKKRPPYAQRPRAAAEFDGVEDKSLPFRTREEAASIATRRRKRHQAYKRRRKLRRDE